jgi:dihydroorotate dehydrogenase (NAD+) catalytic subunit
MIREKSAGKPKVRSAARGAGCTARQARAAASLPVETFTPRIETEIAGVRFQNPVWTASGTFGYAKEFADLIDLNRLGAVCVKGISADPMEGNPEPRIYETASGMLNAIGLQNVGAKRFLSEKLPFLRTLKTRVIVNVFAYSTEDYVRCIEILNEGEGIAAYELNISCPNTRSGGIVYGSDPQLTEEVVAAAKKAIPSSSSSRLMSRI